jgi:hypothetical protein
MSYRNGGIICNTEMVDLLQAQAWLPAAYSKWRRAAVRHVQRFRGLVVPKW